MLANAPAVTSTAAFTPNPLRKTGYSMPRKNNSSSNGASVTPNAAIKYAPPVSLKNLSTGSDLGIGSHRDANSTANAKANPATTKRSIAGPRQFHRIACQKRSRDLARTNTIMNAMTTGYAATCDPITTIGLDARSPHETCRALLRMCAIPSATVLNRNTAASVKHNTAATSHPDHGGNTSRGGSDGSAPASVSGCSPHVSITEGELSAGIMSAGTGDSSGCCSGSAI